MTLIVQKYGGTSVGSPEKIDAVAEKISKFRDDGDDGADCADDDDDGDDVVNPNDDCPDVNAIGYDVDGDGCIDDSDLDGITDNVDLCFTEDLAWPVDSSGCYPVDNPPTIEPLQAPENGTVWNQSLVVSWSVQDTDGDGYRTGARLVHPMDSHYSCLLYTSPSPRDQRGSRMPSSA